MYRCLKRVIDLAVAGVALVVLAPVLLGIGVAIRLGSRGPALFRQERAGPAGRPFLLYKFRTMRPDVDPFGPSPKAGDDPRLTRLGRVLREYSLDELPQLVNIVKGDMSLVGPRSERPQLIEKFQNEIPFYRARLFVKPGLTGWAQVNFGYAWNIDTNTIKQEFDLYYIKHRNLLLDIIIILRTVGTVVGFRGQ